MYGVHSPTYNINFLYIPKCACTLTRQLWCHLHAEDRLHEYPINEWHSILADYPSIQPNCLTYVAIRNPYYRVISMYTDIICTNRIYTNHAETHQHIYSLMGPDTPLTFINFCQYLLLCKENKWYNTNYHFYPQSYFLKDPLAKELYQNEQILFLRCMEKDESTIETPDQNMARQYKDLYLKLIGNSGMDCKIDDFFQQNRIKNVTARITMPDNDYTRLDMVGRKEFPPYQSFLTEETKAIIAEVYRRDFELLEYSL